MRFGLIIFDCDGVLVDTEGLTARVFVEAAKELGVAMDIDQALHTFKGGKMSDAVTWIESQLGRKIPDDFVSNFRAHLYDVFRTELKVIDGVKDVITGLKIPYCVASNGPLEKMQVTLSHTGLLPHFEGKIFSAYVVQRFKPDPGLFLHAAKAHGVAPDRCAVIEDSLPGVRAGVAAGMSVFAYAEPELTSLFEAEGAQVFHSMRDLLELLEN